MVFLGDFSPRVNRSIYTQAMAKYTKELIERTRRLLQPFQDTPLSDEAAREILDNLSALLLYLRELEQKYGTEENL